MLTSTSTRPPPLQAMGDKSADLLELMRDILLTARLDDQARFTQMVAETKAGLEAGEQQALCLLCLPQAT